MFWKRLSPRALFSLIPSSSPSPYSICIAQCSTSSPSHLTYPHSHNHFDPRNVRASVWWDLDSCTVPYGLNAFRGVQVITAAIESSGIGGPIQITAFGDMSRLARTNQEALSSAEIDLIHIRYCLLPFQCSAEINLRHIPYGEDGTHFLFSNLLFWASKNPPPAHVCLITADVSSGSLLHRLKMANYNTLLATKESAPGVLKSAATIMWDWDALVRGKNLTGRYFNQPPVDSWYGHYEGPLEDPYTEIERASFVLDDQPGEVLQQDSFWRDMQIFINTDVGSLIIAESRTREKMAYYLQKYGPSVLKPIMKSDVLLMVDMLISEKKWVLESPYLNRPFKLTSSAGITSANSDCTSSDDEFAYSNDDFSDSE